MTNKTKRKNNARATLNLFFGFDVLRQPTSAPLMLAQPVARLSASRVLMQHRTHVDAFHRNMIWTAGIHVVDKMGAPAAQVGPYGLCD